MKFQTRRFFVRRFWIALIVLCITTGVFSQSTEKSGLQPDVRSKSVQMQREMPYRVILPKEYTKSKKRFPVIYLLHGLTGHYTNWTDMTQLKTLAEKYNFIVVTPEGNDGWYSDAANVSNDKYESYFVKDLIPEIDSKYRTIANRENRFMAGLSMGGYGSLKFGIKYPEMFGLVGSFSGALRAAEWNGKELGGWKALTDSITAVYGDMGSETRRANNLFELTKTADASKLPYIYLDCGTEDFLIAQARDYARLLSEKKIPHEYRELPGKHDWKYWDKQVVEFFRLAEMRLSQTK